MGFVLAELKSVLRILYVVPMIEKYNKIISFVLHSSNTLTMGYYTYESMQKLVNHAKHSNYYF